MNYEKIVKKYAQTRIDLININRELQDFNSDFGEFQDIKKFGKERPDSGWVEVIENLDYKDPDFMELAVMLDKRIDIKKQDRSNKQMLLYAGKKLLKNINE